MASWSRREQHQAYQFVSRRIVSAIVSGEPESTELPMRRFAIAITGGIGVALLVVAGFFVYGLLAPGGGRPAENAIILERETGATYLYLQGRLHPVLNFTSARLLLNQPNPVVRTMSRKSLRDVPRGRSVGIPDAPNSLPAKDSLVGLPWSVCTAPRSPTSVELATQVVVGSVPVGGVSRDDSTGLLVTAGARSDRYLIWQDHRLRVHDNAVVAALGWAAVRPAPVAPAFLNAIPAGPDLTPLQIARAGQPTRHTVTGVPAKVGQVFRAAGKHYVMLDRGLAPVGEVTARLLEATGRRVTDTSAQEVGRLLIDTGVEPPGLPAEIPAASGADGLAMACAVYRGATGLERPVTVESFTQLPAGIALTDPSSSGTGADGEAVADRVALPGGRAGLVAALTAPEATASGNVFIVTDQGIKYPLPRANLATVQAALGYANVRPVVVPGSILALIPTGPALDPAAAANFAEPATVGATPAR